jgi:hypothetical protein
MQADVATRQAFGHSVGKASLPVRSKDTNRCVNLGVRGGPRLRIEENIFSAACAGLPSRSPGDRGFAKTHVRFWPFAVIVPTRLHYPPHSDCL